MTNAWRASEVTEHIQPQISSPLVGEEGARAKRGKVRGNADGLTKRQLLPSNAVARARALRKARTAPEERLWRALREAFADMKFRFQVPFGGEHFGPYYADFCSHRVKLIVEVDGDGHANTVKYDARRTRFLESEGYTVVRVSNADVMENIEGVIMTIAAQIPSPPVGEGGAQRRMRGSLNG